MRHDYKFLSLTGVACGVFGWFILALSAFTLVIGLGTGSGVVIASAVSGVPMSLAFVTASALIELMVNGEKRLQEISEQLRPQYRKTFVKAEPEKEPARPKTNNERTRRLSHASKLYSEGDKRGAWAIFSDLSQRYPDTDEGKRSKELMEKLEFQ